MKMANISLKDALEVRKGGWIQTYTGGRIFPLDPRQDEIHIEDIAHSLALQCRYNGHVNDFYSVAEHSVLLSHAVDKDNALTALMHDASEAYLTDVPRPIKSSFVGYYGFEDRLMTLIALKYGFTWPMPIQVKEYDTRILNDERTQLMSEGEYAWDDYGKPLGVTIEKLRPEVAEQVFLDRFHELTNA
jgi:uncharacterized protein